MFRKSINLMKEGSCNAKELTKFVNGKLYGSFLIRGTNERLTNRSADFFKGSERN